MNKKLVTRIVLIALLILALTTLTACDSSSSPESVVEKYFSAVKWGDNQKCIECFPPTEQAQYKAGASISSKLYGVDADALISALFGTMNVNYYKNYEFRVVNTELTDSSNAIVTVDVYKDNTKSSTSLVYCVKIDGDWYISAIKN